MATKKKSKRAKRTSTQQALTREWQRGYECGVRDGEKRLREQLRELLGVEDTVDKAINSALGRCDSGCCS